MVWQKQKPDALETFLTQSLLGAVLLGQGQYAAAEPLLRQGYEGLKQRADKIPATSKVRLTDVLEWLVQLYDAWGQKDQAEEWRKQLEQTRVATKPPARP